jgi:trans-2-enoyl-CoA reductase
MALNSPLYVIRCQDAQGDIMVHIDGSDGDSAFSQSDLDDAVNAMADHLDSLTGVTLVSVTRNAITGTSI